MKTIKRLLSLFYWNSKLRIARSILYRADFISGFFISVGYAMIGPVTQYLIFTRTKGYPGWSIHQILLFQGILLIFIGIREMLFGDLQTIVNQVIWKGEFDRFLLKPASTIGIILSSCFSINSIGTLLAGLAVTVYYSFLLHLKLTLAGVVLILLSAFFALIFYISMLIFLCGTVVILVNAGRIWEFFDAFLRFSEYPVQIFSRLFQIIFVMFVPFAVFVYFPAQALLNRFELYLLPGYGFCVLIFYLSLKYWNFCLSKYTSAGG